MTADLTKRLLHLQYNSIGEISLLAKEARNEIIWLREEIKRLRQDVQDLDREVRA